MIGACSGALAGISVLISFLLRFDFIPPATERHHLLTGVWMAVVCKWAVFRLMRKDQSWLKYFTLRDLWGLLQANIFGSLLFTSSVFFQMRDFPRSIYCIDLIVCFLLTAAARSSIRIYHEVLASALSAPGARSTKPSSSMAPGGRAPRS